MSDTSKEIVTAIEAVRTVESINAAINALDSTKIMSAVVPVVGSIVRGWSTVTASKEFERIGKGIVELQSKFLSTVANPNSDLARALTALSKFDSVLKSAAIQPKSEINVFLNSMVDVGEAWRSRAPKIISDLVKYNHEIFELVELGKVTPEQISGSFHNALSSGVLNESQEKIVGVSAQSEVKAEIIKTIMDGKSLVEMSPPAFRLWIIIIMCVIAAADGFNKVYDFQKNVSEVFTSAKTPAEARSFARHPPVSADSATFSALRVLTGDRVYLRERPSQKSLATHQLQVGSLLHVLDSSDRAWLLVSVIVDGETYEGWVLRRYTKAIR